MSISVGDGETVFGLYVCKIFPLKNKVEFAVLVNVVEPAAFVKFPFSNKLLPFKLKILVAFVVVKLPVISMSVLATTVQLVLPVTSVMVKLPKELLPLSVPLIVCVVVLMEH